MAYRILCVDPNEQAREDTIETLRTELATLDLVFETAETVKDAKSLLSRDTAAIITEYSLPDGTGVDLINKARETCPDAGYKSTCPHNGI